MCKALYGTPFGESNTGMRRHVTSSRHTFQAAGFASCRLSPPAPTVLAEALGAERDDFAFYKRSANPGHGRPCL